jgi:chromosome segregation ATPase
MAISAELYDFIVKVIEDKTEGIRLLRSDFNDLRAVVYELAQAQKKSEERLTKSEEGLTRVEAAIEKLALAQARTDLTVKNLSTEVAKLSETIDFGIEDIARVVLPGYLHRHEGVVIEDFDRKFFKNR